MKQAKTILLAVTLAAGGLTAVSSPAAALRSEAPTYTTEQIEQQGRIVNVVNKVTNAVNKASPTVRRVIDNVTQVISVVNLVNLTSLAFSSPEPEQVQTLDAQSLD